MGRIETVAKGDGSRIVVPQQVIARDEPDWQALWAAHAGPDVPAPPVDFETRMIAAAFAGERPSPGADVTIERTRRDGAALELVIQESTPEFPVGAQVLVASDAGLYELVESTLQPVAALHALLGDELSVRGIAIGADGKIEPGELK